jgi:hypothetical protein
LLGSYQTRRSCDEIDTYLNQDETYPEAPGNEKGTDEIQEVMTSLLRHLNRSRSALACIAVLGLLTATAAVTALVGAFHASPGYIGRPPWYGYLAFVAESLAVIIPALACVVIAPRAWARGR